MVRPLDLANLQRMIDEKYISVQQHPRLELCIYNYTQSAQYEGVWNNETLQCRGLIMDSSYSIVARPFPKFFNLQEAINKGEQLPAEDFVVTEKMDGSLGILYWEGDKPALATRGSFISDQAIKGTEILHQKYEHLTFNPQYTYLFEIIYPQNRIVVDYGAMEDIVLLAVLHTETGIELPYEELLEFRYTFPIVKKYDGIKDFSKIEARANSEGYVIAFVSGQRFKIKFDEYVRLHRLVTGVNARRIWDLLRNKQPLDELLDRVPDEFFAWVRHIVDRLDHEYGVIERQAIDEYERVRSLPTRKEQALAIKDFSYRSIVFAMLDQKPFAEMIWKLLRPKHETPFKIEI